jgi:hypothetical protein
MSAANIIVTLMRQNEALRFENGWLGRALRGYETEPQCPFPLVSSEELISILHPGESHGGRPCLRR